MRKIQALMILLTVGTVIGTGQENDYRLQAGEPAPYTGVLVPDGAYRYYNERIDLSYELERMAQREAEEPSCETGSDLWPYVALFIGGLSAGLLVEAR